MADENKKPVRLVSVTVSIFVPSMTPEQAQAFEDAIRDAADDYTSNVNISRGAVLNTLQ